MTADDVSTCNVGAHRAPLQMSQDPEKYKTLKALAGRVNQKQPDEIHLIAVPDHQWGNPAAVEGNARCLQALVPAGRVPRHYVCNSVRSGSNRSRL